MRCCLAGNRSILVSRDQLDAAISYSESKHEHQRHANGLPARPWVRIGFAGERLTAFESHRSESSVVADAGVALPRRCAFFSPLWIRTARLASSFLFFAVIAGLPLQAHEQVVASQAVPVIRLSVETVSVRLVEGRDIAFRHLPSNTGLSQTRVEQIAQDEDGFIWSVHKAA